MTPERLHEIDAIAHMPAAGGTLGHLNVPPHA